MNMMRRERGEERGKRSLLSHTMHAKADLDRVAVLGSLVGLGEGKTARSDFFSFSFSWFFLLSPTFHFF